MSKHSNEVYLRHIVEAAGKIAELVGRGGRRLFDEDFAIGDAVVRELEIVGEATRNLSEDFRMEYNNMPWRKMVGMRDWLIHGYAGVDWNKVWNTAVGDIPKLKEQVEEILTGL